MKLTPELIEQALQISNPVRDRELDLRGYKIPVIENLGATLDQYDTHDLSDNDIRKLEGFPYLPRIKTLLLNNNRICRIGDHLEQSIPNLEWLVLTNNNIQELGDLNPLKNMKKLRHMSLLRNPVSAKKHYRLYVIWKLPQITRLDFKRVRLVEREAAAHLFRGKKGRQLANELGGSTTAPSKKVKTFVPGAKIKGPSSKSAESRVTVSKADIQAIKKAINEAKSLEEVDRLNNLLKAGHVPGQQIFNTGKSAAAAVVNGGGGEQEEDEEEDEAESNNTDSTTAEPMVS